MGPVLKTKLFVPRGGNTLIDRSELEHRLDIGRAAGAALTLISAPAGSGKTTLVAGWDVNKAWITLDEHDNDPARFWTYMVAAISTVVTDLEQDIVTCFETTRPPVREFVVGLINELTSYKGDVVIVLDDYHRIDETSIHENLQFFIERLPDTVHVAIVTRSDPPMSLARLRALGLMTELRERDMQFSAHEAERFFARTMDTPIDEAQVRQLVVRTEGWISGLKLAALSMRRCDDPAAFVRSFAGSNQYVLDYLMEEVFSRQTASDKDFLLRTASLRRLSGPLCDAVTGRSDGSECLERLVRANLFVVPLDQERRWYRYHHLFADLLEMRATTDSELHARASAWFESEGYMGEAIEHACIAGDPQRCAELIERSGLQNISLGRMATVWRWLEAVPHEIVLERPLLCVTSAWLMVLSGKVAEAAPFLQAATALASDTPVQAHLELIGAFGSLLRGQLSESVRLAESARKRLEPESAFLSDCAFVIGTASRDQGDLESGLREACELERLGHKSRSAYLVLMGIHDRATISHFKCRLESAVEICREGIAFAILKNATSYAPANRIEVELASVLRLLGDVEAAHDHIERAVANLEDCDVPSDLLNAYMNHGRIFVTLGRVNDAAAIMARADACFRGHDIFPMVAVIYRAFRSAVYLAMGRIDEAIAILGTPSLGFGVLGDVNALALGRLRLAQQRPDAVVDIHTPRFKGVGDRRFFLAMMHTQLSMAQEALGHRDVALAELDVTLDICAVAGCRQLLLDEGKPVSMLIEHGLRSGRWQGPVEAFAASLVEVGEQGLVDPLSDRELEVLRLVAQGHTNKTIAAQLFISVGTVKTHVHHICSKLHVANRTEAVARAQQLRLV